MEKQVQWWRQQYENLPPPIELPADHPRPVEQNHAGANEGVVLPKADYEKLLELAKDTGTTLFMVLYAAFEALLHRWSGDTDLLVGTPVRNRTHPELEELIGPFINAIAMRTRMEPEKPFADFLARVRDVVLEAFNHQEMPFESLGTRPPVVRAFFSLQDARKRPPGLGEVKVKQVHVLPKAATNDLMLWVMETRDGLLLMLNYSTELYEQQSAKEFLAGFRTLLGSVLEDVKRPVRELPLLPKEQAEAVAAFSPGPAPDALVHASVPRSGDAIVTPDGVESWGQLAESARGLAGALEAKGAGLGSVVAVACEGADWLRAALAALQAGAAVLPVDPRWPPEFLNAQLKAANVTAVVAGEELAAELTGVRVVGPRESAPAKAVAVGPDDAALAWLGFDEQGRAALSTVPHRSLVASLTALAQHLSLKSGQGLLWASAPGSEGEALELFLPLVTGAKALVAEDGCYRDGELLQAEVARLKPQVAIATGAAWAGAKAAGFTAGATKAVCLGAAPAGLEAVRLNTWLGRGLLCLADAKSPPETLGRALPGALVEVRDEPATGAAEGAKPQRTPVNMPGALWAGPRANAMRPTGERARWRRDGTLERWGPPAFAERWGMRFPLGLPSKALAGHEALSQAVVVMVPGAEERLAAFVVVKRGESFTDTELRRQVRQALPQAMVPQEFHELEALPKNAKGEVDLAALLERLEPKEEHVPPRTPTEQLLAELWRGALNLPAVSVRDNFFNLGGHSLLCFRVLSEVEKKTGKRLNPRMMLLSTLEQVAAQIDR